jgi:hypothetical protein
MLKNVFKNNSLNLQGLILGRLENVTFNKKQTIKNR